MGQIFQFILHMPWWAAGLVAVVGVWLFVLGNSRLDKTLRRVGAGVFIAAVVLGLVGFFYLTPLQKAVARTRQMVRDVDQQNWPGLQSLLDDQTVVEAVGRTMAAGRDDVMNRMKAAHDRYGVKSVWTLSIEGMQTDTLITVTATVVSEQDFTGGQPITSTWQLDFQEDDDVWQLEKITLLRIGGDNEQHPLNPF